ncbi:MAG: cyclic nucleotide-binding domain-containing protein [Deltaproteobacteria bacterium]|nr:cyclic nucleotide-binding domain-containing protein [Deltaproteobacteria bacterium]
MEDLGELKNFLSNIAIFGGLEEATLDRIVGMLRWEEHPKGSVVVREGENGFSMYVVRSGEVALYRKGSRATDVRMARLGPGEFFGEMAIIDVQARSASVVVEEPAILYSLTNRDLYTLYQSDMPGYVMVIQNLCRELSRRLRRADARITQTADQASDETTQIRKLPIQ